VRKSFLPEFISMNAMMAGMAPVMSLLMMGRDMRAMVPTELIFWGIMSLGVIVGFVIAYPANVWLVQRGLKHGLMTERKEEERKKSHKGQQGSHGGHDKKEAHDMSSDVTVPQLASVAGFTTLMLLAGMVVPAFTSI
jgi:hypothetical protein